MLEHELERVARELKVAKKNDNRGPDGRFVKDDQEM